MTEVAAPDTETVPDIDSFGAGDLLHPSLRWDNEPSSWRIGRGGSLLTVDVETGTNYWQATRHGRREDNGHVLGVDVAGDVVLEVAVSSTPTALYDQAGLILHESERSWVKTSAEYDPHGFYRLGAVVTVDGWSDWSSHDVDIRAHRLRLRRRGDTVTVEVSMEDGPWTQVRLAHFPARGVTRAGVYACAPVGIGFTVEFDQFTVVLPDD